MRFQVATQLMVQSQCIRICYQWSVVVVACVTEIKALSSTREPAELETDARNKTAAKLQVKVIRLKDVAWG